MSRARKIKIADCEYTIQVVDAEAALIGFGTLAKYLMGPLGQLLASEKSSDPELLSNAMRELGHVLSAADMRALCFDLIEDSTVTAAGGKPMPLVKSGNRVLWKQHFAGKIGESMQLFWFAIKENFANFFDALPDLVQLRQKIQKMTQGDLSYPSSTTGDSQD